MWAWLQHMTILPEWERRRWRLWIWIHMLSGITLAVVSAMVSQYLSLWGLALLAPAGWHFYLAYLLARPAIQRERAQSHH